MSRSFGFVALLVSLLVPAAARGQARAHFQVGVHGGFNFTNGSVEDERLGIQGSIPVVWRLTLNPAFSYLYNYPDDPTGFYEGSAWETYFTLRVHPLGNDSFLSVGYGFTLVHASLRTSDGSFDDSDTDGTDVGVIALSLPQGRVRPFAEVYLIDLLERQSAVGGHLLFGLNLRIP
jgi:hypothetical protein